MAISNYLFSRYIDNNSVIFNTAEINYLNEIEINGSDLIKTDFEQKKVKNVAVIELSKQFKQEGEINKLNLTTGHTCETLAASIKKKQI